MAALTFTPAAWEDRVADDLGLLRDLEPREVPIYRDGVQSGTYGLLRATRGGELAGWVIWSLSHEPDHRVVIIHAAVILPAAGEDAARAIVDGATRAAKRLGASRLRCWTTRPGLVRKITKLGAQCRTVLELDL